MQLEAYFDFHAPDDIRLKGHRMGIETILLDYLELGLSPETIVVRYPTLTLEEAYATLTYYWRHQAQMDAYLRAWRAHHEQMQRAQAENPSPAVLRLRALAQQRLAAAP
ncbi:MAG: DUF433 domain-containing protein [Anaerolineae bacterium]|nr:DUF433 domain-containing protein [Anaerolineae bacterium]